MPYADMKTFFKSYSCANIYINIYVYREREKVRITEIINVTKITLFVTKVTLKNAN